MLANDPCPAIEPGPGKVVLTTVNHLNRDIWELTLADAQGRAEQLRPTGLHKFYSQSRGEWVSTQDLRTDELLGGLHRPLSVASLHRVPGVHRVYNMTVEGEHVYHVSALAVVAHNEGCGPSEVPMSEIRPLQDAAHNAPRPELRRLSDAELLQAARNPVDGNRLLINPRTGRLADGNG